MKYFLLISFFACLGVACADSDDGTNPAPAESNVTEGKPPKSCMALPECAAPPQGCSYGPSTCVDGEPRCGDLLCPKADLDGEWGDDHAIMRVAEKKATIELDCGSATIDNIHFLSNVDFSASGTFTMGSGVRPLPGQEPQPQPATFVGDVAGNALTLDMTVDGNTTTFHFTKDRVVQLRRCL